MAKTHTLPTGTMATALTPIANAVKTNHAYFDPSDLVMDYLAHAPELYAKTMASMAWSVDNACINQARNILFTYYAAAQERAENASDVIFSEYCAEVSEDLAHESLYLAGPELDNPEYVLAVLLAIRDQWHDAAFAAAAADNRDYNPKSLRELMDAEKPRDPDVGTIANHKVMAKLEANGDEALETRMLESMIAADKLASIARVARSKPLRPTLLEILRTVKAYGTQESARFDQLPASMQRSLTTQAMSTLDRSSNDLASRLARQPIAFARTAEAKYQCKKALEAVILAKFTDDGDLENVTSQAQHDINRAAKRKAMCSID